MKIAGPNYRIHALDTATIFFVVVLTRGLTGAKYGIIIITRNPLARPLMSPRRPSSDPKLEALREQGTANPRPEDVLDPAFSASEFFDPRDLVQVKYEMLRRVRSEGHSVAEASKSFGLSRPTFYKAQADFEQHGLTGLLPSKRGPRGPHKMTAEVLTLIARLLTTDPGLDAVSLAERVSHKLGLHVHRRTIERALTRSKKKPR